MGIDLSTNYMGLKLNSPLVVGSSTLSNSIENIKKMEKLGVGAVVLNSLFEEQITNQADSMDLGGTNSDLQKEGKEYLNYYVKNNEIGNYINLIKDAKKEVNIPIIASINCNSANEWIDFAKKIEDAGADALEVNIFILPADDTIKSDEIEANYFEISKKLGEILTIPFALKLGTYFSGFSHFLTSLSYSKLSGMVLFNRFYSPDIDIENMKIVEAGLYSSPIDLYNTLRWTALLSGKLDCEIAASTGIHDGEAMIKVLLAGAQVAYSVSTFYLNGLDRIEEMLNELKVWMKKHNYDTIESFRGKLSKKRIKDYHLYERGQFMKYFSSHK